MTIVGKSLTALTTIARFAGALVALGAPLSSVTVAETSRLPLKFSTGVTTLPATV